ncbi:hypothetical protein HMPREF9074_07302 [Capnocytophaga sp. oral taxon 329 str. F0087]|nr:hypothetical protein HMPREF9074_07302 [Capnocytophaga sp. oral taxon 329 str. F0087]
MTKEWFNGKKTINNKSCFCKKEQLFLLLSISNNSVLSFFLKKNMKKRPFSNL